MKNYAMKNINDINLSTRYASIDLLETVAILLVIIYHSTIYSWDIVNGQGIVPYINYFLRTLLSPCVALFFFANGFLLFNRELNLRKHIFKTISLVILCGVWGLIKILILMPIRNEFLSPADIIKGVWTWKEGWIHSLWFIGTLVCIYVFFPLLKVAYDNNRKVFYYFVIVCAVLTFGNVLINQAGTIFLTYILNKPTVLQGRNVFNFFNPFRNLYGYAFVYFCIGGCFYKVKDAVLSIRPLKRNLIALATMLLSCLGLWGVGIAYSKAANDMWDLVWNGYDTIFTFVNVLCIFILCTNWRKDLTIFRIISANTLGIYFIHEIFIQLTRGAIVQYWYLRNIPFNIVYAVLILLLSLAITLILRRIPVLNRLVSI